MSIVNATDTMNQWSFKYFRVLTFALNSIFVLYINVEIHLKSLTLRVT